MSDMTPMNQDLTPPSAIAPDQPGAPIADPGASSSSRLVKVIAAAAGLIALFALIGIAAYLFMSGAGGAPEKPSEPEVSAGITKTAALSTKPDVPDEPPLDVPISDVFSFRDIFKPTVKPTKLSTTPTESTETSGPGGTTPGGNNSSNNSNESSPTKTSVGENTLFLQDIVTEDGQQVAVLILGSTEYRAKEGDRLDDTPWKVLEIDDNSVVMLFGDTQLTLSVGQGLTK